MRQPAPADAGLWPDNLGTSGATAAAIDENAVAERVVYTATSTDTGGISTGATVYSLTGAVTLLVVRTMSCSNAAFAR